jgi:hypothetical protein
MGDLYRSAQHALAVARGATDNEPRRMKLTATIVVALRARSLAEAGTELDDVLAPARDRDDIDIKSVDLQTPSGGPPVMLPHAAPSPAPAPVAPPPLPDGR